MPLLPGEVKLGQGFPGGSSSLPGEITGLGRPGSIPTSPGFKLSSTFDAPPLPSPTLTSAPRTGTFSTPDPSRKSYQLSTAMALLDQVRQGVTPWQDAQKVLKDLSDTDRNALHTLVVDRFNKQTQMGKINLPPPLDELRAISAPGPSGGGGILGHLKQIAGAAVGDTTSLVHGFLPGMALAGKALGSDIAGAVEHPIRAAHSDSQFYDKVLKPLGEQESKTWGPLVKGIALPYKALGEKIIGHDAAAQRTAQAGKDSLSTFAKGFESHPLGPVLDMLAVASAGAGAAGRIGNASKALSAADISRGADGVAQIGAKAGINLKVFQTKGGVWQVRNRGQIVASRFPDEQSAIAHAQSLSTGGLSGNAFKIAMKGFTGKGPQGSLIEAYEKARGITHEAEHQQIMEEVASVLDNPNLRLDRRSVGQVVRDVGSDLRATSTQDLAKPLEMSADHPGFVSPTLGKALTAGEIALREASDLVRAGAIYLRPAYLPNNWAGNSFMTLVHQGAYAPINLAKSMVISKHMDPRNLAALRRGMGQNAAEVVTAGKGRGYISSLTQPVAHVMGALADQPFRDAAMLHELRKMGYTKLSQVDDLFSRAGRVGEDSQSALHDIAVAARKGQEEIVKFGHMNDTERSVLRNLVFVYSWMRGAGRYAGRFPFQHPIQTAMFNQESHQGNDWLNKNLGGVPSFLVGAIPVGHDKNGNPILINPFSLNPLGTGLQIAQAATGAAHIIGPMANSLLHGREPVQFNRYAETDLTSLFNPIAQAYIQGHEGQPVDLQSTIAGIKLAKDLQHPGEGSVYPTTREEAIGHFMVGSLFPRVANQQAITKSLERENSNHPLSLIPEQVKTYEKLTGNAVPPEMVAAYQADVIATQQQKDFQTSYAQAHGQSGFKNLPAQNKAEAAIKYLSQHKLMSAQDLKQITDTLYQLTTDAEFNDLANTLWSSTGTGSAKRAWDQMMKDAKNQQLSRKRP